MGNLRQKYTDEEWNNLQSDVEKPLTKYKIIEKYIQRIMVDYPEADKIHIDLVQFAEEIRQCNVSSVLPEYTACGGCGANHPSQRCINCLHDFGGRRLSGGKL